MAESVPKVCATGELTIGLHWTAGFRFCCMLDALNPPPVRPGVSPNALVRLMAILGFLASLFGAGCKPSSQPPSGQSSALPPAQVMRELRTKMLTTAPSGFGIAKSTDFPRVYGVLMDWPLGEQTITVVSLCDGNASLYTTSTFGIIGGVGHDSVRAAAARFVRAAEKHHNEAVVTREYPYPVGRHVRFYLVCFDGVRVIETDLDALTSGRDSRLDLWTEGQRVVTELRLVTEKTEKKP